MSSYNNFGWRENLIATPFTLGVTLLIVNQRIGFEDAVGLNLIAVVLRSELWLTLGVVFCIFLAPRYLIRLPKNIKVMQSVMLHLPIAFVLATLFATFLSYFRYNQIFDLFGLLDILKTLLCICIGRIVFGLSTENHKFTTLLINLLAFSSILNVLAGIFTYVTDINNIAGFNDQTAGEVEVGLGFVSYGGRFQGLSTNPNIVATQATIALSFLLPLIMRYTTDGRVMKVLFTTIYSLSLVGIVLWTGVRAALLVIPLICILAVWLRMKRGLRGQVITIAYMPLTAALIALAWVGASSLGLTDTVVDRVSNSEDGRLFLWTHYGGLLLENPFGMGIAFETIADTYSILERQRLPPHNSLLQTGMYGGFIGIFVFLLLLRKTWRFFFLYRKNLPTGNIPVYIQGTFIAWLVTLLNSMFGGLWSTDFNFSILTSLLIFQVYEARSRRNNFKPVKL